MLGIMQILTSCAKNTATGSIPCSSLSLVYYDEIKPERAEISVLLNNAVISKICKQ